MLKKIKNFFNYSLSTNEIIKLLKMHMMKVSGKCTEIDPKNLYLVDINDCIHGADFVILYEWNGLHWEICFDREVTAYGSFVAEERYKSENMRSFRSLEGVYVSTTKKRRIVVYVEGKRPGKLWLKRKKY